MAGVLASVAALLATRVPEGRQGAMYGVNTTIVAGANALAPMIGASVAIWWGLRSVFLVAAVLFVLAGLVTLWLLPAAEPMPEKVKSVQ
jgi:DHA1 family multidrug resistance protein-like MFS transporter